MVTANWGALQVEVAVVAVEEEPRRCVNGTGETLRMPRREHVQDGSERPSVGRDVLYAVVAALLLLLFVTDVSGAPQRGWPSPGDWQERLLSALRADRNFMQAPARYYLHILNKRKNVT